MPPYSWLNHELVLMMFGIGIGISIAIMLARGILRWNFSLKKQSDEDIEKSLHEFPGGVKEYNRPMPLIIWLVFIGYFIWAAGYLIFSGYYDL